MVAGWGGINDINNTNDTSGVGVDGCGSGRQQGLVLKLENYCENATANPSRTGSVSWNSELN